MVIRCALKWPFAFLLALVAGCAGLGQESLTIRPQERVVYRCQDGERIVARYYVLSDGSLAFVKVLLPEGREITLPQAMSASGVRYTDDREWVWWTRGDAAFAEARSANGEWRIRYDNCRSPAAEP